jgi:predicted transcriptional regulator
MTVTGAAVTSSIIVAAAVGGLAGGTEFGKYRFLSLLFVPLYTKIHKDKVLDHFTRGRVYEYIRNNPGSHYSLIKRELGLNNGGLTYHLRTLEREELIRARRVGIYKLFYTTKTQIPETIGLGLNEVQKTIVENIRTNPGITQTEIGAKIPDKSQRTISHHIKTMERKGILVLEKEGRDTKCFIADTYEEQAEVSSGEKGVPPKPPVEAHELKPESKDMMFKEI